MENSRLKTMQTFVFSAFFFSSIGCSEDLALDTTSLSNRYKAITNPSWKTDARFFLSGPGGSFDEVSVKDPSVVYFEGKYHLFYTARDKHNWRTGYVSASSLSSFKTSSRTLLSNLSNGSCAPQVFWSEAKNKWFMIYQKGREASFSVNDNISNTEGWSATKSMGFSDGLDYWCISDGKNVYCFYSAQDGSYTLKRRGTTVDKFPFGWSTPTTIAAKTFEAPHVYKNKADGKYYMVAEDYTRHFQLWNAKSLDGKWTKISEYWAAAYNNLTETSEHWTDQVSHGEILRSGINEYLEINDISRCEILIQGVLNDRYKGDYTMIPYMLGVIRNY